MGSSIWSNVRVPVSNLIGKEGEGLTQMEELLEISRVFIAATSLGTAERAFRAVAEIRQEARHLWPTDRRAPSHSALPG